MDANFLPVAAAIVRADMMICGIADLIPYIIVGAVAIIGGLFIMWYCCTKD